MRAFVGSSTLLCAALVTMMACTDNTLSATPTYNASGTSSGDDGDPDSGSGDAALTPDAFPPPMSDSIEIVVEPGDNGNQLLAAVQGAKTSIHMTMYLLSDQRFISALITKAKSGIDVKVVLNQTFTTGDSGSNQAVYTQLQSGGVNVVWAPSVYTLTHEKCVIIDGSEAWIMTMNLASSSPQNREYLALDTVPDDITEAEAIFGADYGGLAVTPSGALVVSPMTSRPKLLQLLQTATTSIDLEGEEFSDSMITSALVAAKQAGATVRVVLADNDPTDSQATAIAALKAASIPVVSVHEPYIHSKAVVVDGTSMYIGSENFTTSSLQYNRELGIITSNAASVSKVKTTIATDFAAGTAL